MLSVNDRELAERTSTEWHNKKVPLGYGLSIETARAWGLYVSNGVNDKEPTQFVEPGLFVIRPDGTLYASSLQTMPFARPHTETLLKSLDWILQNDYPARGEA